MLRFIVRRLLGMVAVLFAISVLVFLIFNVVPATNPARGSRARTRPRALIKNVEEEWGFDKSLPEQYVTQMKQVFTGELVSPTSRTSTSTSRSSKACPATISLCIGAAIIWLSFGILFGYLSAVRAGRLTDRLLTVLALIGISMPVFWLASILLYYFTYKTELFPAERVRSAVRRPGRVGLPPDPALDHPGGPLRRLLQPRAALQHARRDERGLRADGACQGVERAPGMIRHVLRNSLIPVITLFGLDFGALSAAARSSPS